MTQPSDKLLQHYFKATTTLDKINTLIDTIVWIVLIMHQHFRTAKDCLNPTHTL